MEEAVEEEELVVYEGRGKVGGCSGGGGDDGGQ